MGPSGTCSTSTATKARAWSSMWWATSGPSMMRPSRLLPARPASLCLAEVRHASFAIQFARHSCCSRLLWTCIGLTWVDILLRYKKACNITGYFSGGACLEKCAILFIWAGLGVPDSPREDRSLWEFALRTPGPARGFLFYFCFLQYSSGLHSPCTAPEAPI